MNTRACKQALLAATALLAAAFPLQSQAASVDFDFTSGGAADSLVDAGNIFSFDSMGINVDVRAFGRDSSGLVESATVVQSSANYADLGFTVASGVEGLGICSAADGSFKNCLKRTNKFAAGRNDREEWFLLMFDTPLQLESFTVDITNNKAGQVDYFVGNVDPNTLTVNNYQDYFGERVSFDYGRRAGSQTIELALMQTHNALLIGGDAGSTRFTLTQARATVVPVPPSLLLFGSALAGLAVMRRRAAAPTS